MNTDKTVLCSYLMRYLGQAIKLPEVVFNRRDLYHQIKQSDICFYNLFLFDTHTVPLQNVGFHDLPYIDYMRNDIKGVTKRIFIF